MTLEPAVPVPLLGRMRLPLLALRLAGTVVAVLFAAGVALAQSLEDPEAVDPPGRVGSVTLLAGPVTMVDLATGSREQALLNWPVTGGWRIETGAAGRAEVRLGSTALRLDDDTTVDFARLDDQYVQIAVLRGSVSLRLRSRELLGEIEVLTQRERMTFEEVGRYRIDVDRTPGVTAVSALGGRVRIAINGSTFVVNSGQRGELSASPLVSFEITGAVGDDFDAWVAARDAREDTIRSTAYVSAETTGVELLDEYGYWRSVEEYGPVWFPRGVPATWAPYRYGRWIWVSPWGWTWIDDAPWGFAPLHYGRWVVIGGYWGWIPGAIVPRPIYAPALVAWFSGPGISITVGAPIGWFPLGPREVYVPAYRHTPRYLRVVNVQNVPNVARVTIVRTPTYVHRHPDRSTWVPGDRFGRPDPVQAGRRPPPSEWRRYIADPQPPANVPNTKRRQATEAVGRAAPVITPPTAPAAPASRQPVVRPPSVVPRAVEAPRPVEAPRAVEVPRAVPPAPAPAVRPEPPPGAGAVPGADSRRMAPRAPATPRPAAPYTPPREAAPAAAPGRPPRAPAAPPIDYERPRGQAPAPAGRLPAAPSAPPRQRPAAPPASAPQSSDAPGPRGRGGPAPRDERPQAPRSPEATGSAAPQAAPAPGAPAAGETVRKPVPRPIPSTRPDSGEQRSERPGVGREAVR